MTVPIFQVDAFTGEPFAGNPAAVCLLERPAKPSWMQAVAAEMNLSETAFVVGEGEHYRLRWFTPAVEVDLCGHATLATAHVLWTETEADRARVLRFLTKSGELTAAWRDRKIELDFPAQPPTEIGVPDSLAKALGTRPEWVGQSMDDLIVLLESEEAVRALEPDFVALGRVEARGISVTAPSADSAFDFVSRFFAPRCGINEDPVTGSAHCRLGPFWAERLGRPRLRAYQASSRGGAIEVEIVGDRTRLRGQAVTILRGELQMAPQ